MKHILPKTLLSLGILGGVFSVEAYDVQNKALTPVEFGKAPEHAPVPLVKNGKPDFVIVTDKEAENRMRGKNKTQKSIEPAVEIIQEAFEKCTGVKPEVVDVKDASKYPRMIVVGVMPCSRL